MTSITVDAATAAKLAAVNESVQLCDEAGNVLGMYAPTAEREHKPTMDEIIAKRQTPPEEVQRRYREESHLARPLQEIWPEIERQAEQGGH